jgi:hypothetical protein
LDFGVEGSAQGLGFSADGRGFGVEGLGFRIFEGRPLILNILPLHYFECNIGQKLLLLLSVITKKSNYV